MSVDVCVVGAGIAGLHAARHLVDVGLEVVVLEARDRVGGRLHRHEHNGAPFDLGATWFWPGEHRVAALVDSLDVAVHAHYLAGDAIYHDRPASQRLSGNSIDVPSGRFTGSAAALAEAVAAELPADAIRFGTPVQAVSCTDGSVVVHCESDVLVDAQHVVLALPPALAHHTISFTPDLPQPLAGLIAMTPVWMGAIAKVVTIYDRPFWREAGLAGAAISHYGPMREIHDMSGPDGSPAALFGFVPLSSGAPEPSYAAIVEQLVELFGPEAAEPQDLAVCDWSNERFTSPPNAADLGNYRTYGHPLFAEPAHGRIHWASTETATEAPGHIEGALMAAERAVDAITAELLSSNSTS